MLAIGLEQLQQESPALPAEVRSQMGELKKQTFEIAADIQSLSHELHSAKLQYLGIAAAMRGFCQEFGEQQRVGLTSKPTICQAPGRQILRFASSEFCKKPCTIR
jgi:signal transduction histidine kinase